MLVRPAWINRSGDLIPLMLRVDVFDLQQGSGDQGDNEQVIQD